MKKLVLSALAVSAITSAWAIQGTLYPKVGSALQGDIKWKVASKEYTIAYKKGATTVTGTFKEADVDSLDIPEPANLGKAIEMINNKQGRQAIGLLKPLVTEYKMLNWDKPAARWLVSAYLDAGDANEANKIAQGIINDNKDSAYTGEFAPAYWQVLLKLGKLPQLENCLKKAAASGDRASSAAALNMRGDIIVAQGGGTNESYTKALTDGYLRVALMYGDEPCRDARRDACFKAAECFRKLNQASRANDMEAKGKAL